MNLKKRQLRWDFINAYKYLKVRMGSDFSVVPSNKISCNGHKLKHRKFHLNVKKKISTEIESESVKALEQGAGCRFSFSRDIQNLPGQNPVQPGVGEPALAQGLEVVDLQIISPFQFQPFYNFFLTYSKTRSNERCFYANPSSWKTNMELFKIIINY